MDTFRLSDEIIYYTDERTFSDQPPFYDFLPDNPYLRVGEQVLSVGTESDLISGNEPTMATLDSIEGLSSIKAI